MSRGHAVFFNFVVLAVLLAANTHAQSKSRDKSVDTSTWKTHCFGRFQIALPPQAKIGATYRIWRNNVERSFEDISSIKKRFDEKERHLKSKKHDSRGSMFVSRTKYEGGSESIISWEDPSSVIFMSRESYLVSPDWRVKYQYNGEVSPEKISSSQAFTKKLAESIRSRRPDAIPTEPGFCLDGGYIAGNDDRSEGVDVGVTLPEHPGAHISFYSSTGAEEDTLLDRIGGFMRTDVLGRLAGIKTLRKRKRNLGPIPGEEYLFAATEKGQRLYGFKWESQGKDDSLSEPNLSLELNVIGSDDDEELPPKAFKSDEEALELWDALLESIRLWPGAV